MPANGSLAGLSERLRDMQPDDVIAWPLVGPDTESTAKWDREIRALVARLTGKIDAEFSARTFAGVTNDYEVVRCMLIRRTA